MTANTVDKDLPERVRVLEGLVRELARPRAAVQLNKRDLADCRQLTKIQDGQTDVYDKATGGWKPASLGTSLTNLRATPGSTDILSSGVTGDAFNRFALHADGTLWTGVGTATPQRALAFLGVGGTITNIGIGTDTLPSLDPNEVNNVAVGHHALNAVATGSYNTAVGGSALSSVTGGALNTAVGIGAGAGVTTGVRNIFVGVDAGVGFGGGFAWATTTGSDQVAIGSESGQYLGTQRSKIVCLGKRAVCGGDNTMALGHDTYAIAANATALGCGAQAQGAGSVAIGRDSTGAFAQAFATDEFVLGTAAHKVTVTGHALLAGPAKTLGFHGASGVAKQTVTGSRGGNAALASLLTAFATLGLLTDSTTA